MTDNITKFPSTGAPEFLVGPFEEYRVVVEGRMIPKLTGFREGERTVLIVDRRMSISVPNDIAYDVALLVAEALAVGAGYSHLGAENKSERPFAPRSMEITSGIPK